MVVIPCRFKSCFPHFFLTAPIHSWFGFGRGTRHDHWRAVFLRGSAHAMTHDASVGSEPVAPAQPPINNQPAEGEAASASRRIPIGTQRAGVAPPSLAPKYQYVAPSAAAAPPPVAPLAPSAESPRAIEAGEAVALTAVASAAVASAGGFTPVSSGPGQESGSRGGRGRRRDAPKRISPADILPPAKRVAVPSLRAGLDEDLEADFAAAIEGIAIDDILEAQSAIKAEAPLDPGSRITGVVLSIGADTAFIDLGGRRQGALKLAGFLDRGEDLPEVGAAVELSVGGRNEEDGLYDVAPANRAVAVEDWSRLKPEWWSRRG